MTKLINDTDFIKYPLLVKGKVRNVYDLGDKLLMIATDRISAFDVVFPNLIPKKGKVLNKISSFWFDYTCDIVPNHVITTDINQFPDELKKYKEELEGRSMIVKKMQMLPVECIVRGYLEGSGLKDYKNTGSICGIKLPEGLRQADKLPEPIFTPSTKALEGHDENVGFDVVADKVGYDIACKLRDISIKLYEKAGKYAESKGLILADTKFEFGIIDGHIVAGDEMFTPDSSRYWDMNDYEPGRPQKSFDKQYLRDYLEQINWNKMPPAPVLPQEVVDKTQAKYIEAYERITGRKVD